MSANKSANLQINWDAYETQLAEGKGHVKFGLGVGAVGAISLAVIGTTCPLCFVVAPAMVGVGAWKAQRAKAALKTRDESPLAADSGSADHDPDIGNI